jgi:PAS domain S-box-containing protein
VAFEKFGYTQEDFDKGVNLHQFIVEGDRKRAEENTEKLLRETNKGPFEYNALRKDGSELPVIVYDSPIIRDGMPVGFRGIIIDITERKQAEENLENASKKLIENNKELERIIYVASHDMRTPLVTISGFSNELLMAAKDIISILKSKNISDDEKDKELSYKIEEDIPSSIKFISSSIRKIQMMLDGLLFYSRSGRYELKIEEVNLKETIMEIVASTKFDIDKSGVQIQINRLPHCFADRARTNQIFSNLIENAIKFLEPSRPGKITISGKKKGSKVTYCVEDNGIGISEDKLDDVFMVFYRVNVTDKTLAGEGLGLATVKKLVERHNGKIWVESTPGKGSKFFVELSAVK